MNNFTDEQLEYIKYVNNEDTKLIACAGSGKTRCIIFRIDNLIKTKQFNNDEILMLTFSRFTRDDFINKIKSLKIKTILDKNIKTIDSFAKHLIDDNNEIDVSLLSYKLMQYLEQSSKEEIQKNSKISKIKIIFVDEAQDLNETQYKILAYLKEKNNVLINLIGDPNQNIYQFRNSSDKYLTAFDAKTFNLTKNFRSYNSIINFSKHLRPVKQMNVCGMKGKGNNCKPLILFHEDDNDFKENLIKFFKDAAECGIDFSDIAILSPTRGRMKGFGGSNGLCLVSNVLYENDIKFKQFYEESTDEVTNNINYCPKKGHVNILTYMGSKGLEWKFVILIDANICLINKRQFNKQKHKNDQYLLYVACSRAVENMVIFSKFRKTESITGFQLNPWFSLVPKQYYVLDNKYKVPFKYPNVKSLDMGQNEKRVTKLLDSLTEENLDKLCQLCQYSHNSEFKTTTRIFDKDFSLIISSNIFLGKYVENLFCIHYKIAHGLERKRFVDIENIIESKNIITDVPAYFSEWYYTNREHYTWNTFEQTKDKLETIIVNIIESRFNKSYDFASHTIVNDGYFKSFILSLKSSIARNYSRYLTTKNLKMMRNYLFYIMVIVYAFETQHYFHVKNKGKKFKNILTLCSDLFDKIEYYASTTKINFTNFNVCVESGKTIGEIDALETNDGNINIWEFKCTSEITLKHVLQVLMYNIIYNKLEAIEEDSNVNINFINFLKGEIVNIEIPITKDKINQIINILA